MRLPWLWWRHSIFQWHYNSSLKCYISITFFFQIVATSCTTVSLHSKSSTFCSTYQVWLGLVSNHFIFINLKARIYIQDIKLVTTGTQGIIFVPCSNEVHYNNAYEQVSHSKVCFLLMWLLTDFFWKDWACIWSHCCDVPKIISFLFKFLFWMLKIWPSAHFGDVLPKRRVLSFVRAVYLIVLWEST